MKKIFRRLAALVLCCALLAGTVPAAFAAAAYEGTAGNATDYFVPVAESMESFETKTAVRYISDTSNKKEIEIGVLNGMDDIPYLSLETIADLLQDTFAAYTDQGTAAYSLELDAVTDDNSAFMLLRENESAMVVDFNANTITFTDLAAFCADPEAANPMDVVDTFSKDGKTFYSHTSMFYCKGDTIVVDLGHYGIPTAVVDGKGWLPLQTVADLIFGRIGLYLLCNGEAVIVTNAVTPPDSGEDLFGDILGTMTGEEGAEAAAEPTATPEPEVREQTLSDIYYAGAKGAKSEALTTFTYNELCLALDYNYGLKSEHGITSFNSLFLRSGLADRLRSSDAGDVYIALTDLCSNYFADSHSAANAVSYRTDLDPNSSSEVLSAMVGHLAETLVNMERYENARSLYYPDGPVGYEEVGDTAYVTFDAFSFDNERDYYNTELTNNPEDTIELILYANRQIRRENSPVKNVVIDLSNNGGGYADAAVAVLSWMIGTANINIVDPITGAQSTTSYIFDANLDGQTDLFGDSLATLGVNRYCIISPNSFSCGNLVPYMLAASDMVTLIGRASQGGACVVENMSTADGNVFQISGPRRISSVRNGSYYSVDQGVEPDIYITKIKHLYDRAYLTELIDQQP